MRRLRARAGVPLTTGGTSSARSELTLQAGGQPAAFRLTVRDARIILVERD